MKNPFALTRGFHKLGQSDLLCFMFHIWPKSQELFREFLFITKFPFLYQKKKLSTLFSRPSLTCDASHEKSLKKIRIYESSIDAHKLLCCYTSGRRKVTNFWRSIRVKHSSESFWHKTQKRRRLEKEKRKLWETISTKSPDQYFFFCRKASRWINNRRFI